MRRRCSPATPTPRAQGEITTRQLVELTRRLNPDRVVVGELVEDEALDMLDVASMCKRGSLATIHAHTADVVLQRLAYYVSKSNTQPARVRGVEPDRPDRRLRRSTSTSSATRPSTTARRVRRVTSIIEVGGLGERGGLATTEVWGIGHDGQLVQLAPLSTRHLQRLRLAGYDPQLFAPAVAW